MEGFDLIGVAPIDTSTDAERFGAWLDAGMHGEMQYLERYRDRIRYPSRVLQGARSILSLGVNFARKPGGFAGGGRVARYALGRDYHHVIENMARRFITKLRGEGIGGSYRTIVDAGPALERSLGAYAGHGFASKSANLLNYKYGPWFFLAEIFIDVELPAPPVKAPGSCGTCNLCIERCPTGAIVSPGRVDARICISYLTIEYKGKIPAALRPQMQDWVFGCDVCSEVCPFGDGAPDAAARFGTHDAFSLTLEDLLKIDEARFIQLFAGSPLRRAKREGLARNAAIVLGNLKRTDAASLLKTTAAEDPSEVVRDAAEWALQQFETRSSG
ncbi:MAG: tRNA epoxyqueuosine(34) reductase QueG [Planctomycetes bacterium]|nr:tRNA epoxyqueuosine(34) reductase QueG [Planctomycetota bacterium]